jgi:UDP-2,3-diacylglucosamine pyrophosphatase LpxH
LDKIRQVNEPIFDLFRGDFSRHFGSPGSVTVSVTYVPGNHDRICNLFPQARALVAECLGLSPAIAAEPFPWDFLDHKHHVYARHGHEYDAFNYSGGADLSAAAHTKTPIGDVLTSMLGARLPRAVYDLSSSFTSQDELDKLMRNLGVMFDVRPMASLIPFLSYQVRSLDEPRLRQAVTQAIRQSAREFRNIPFARKWMRHNGWSGKLLALLFLLLDRIDLFSVGSWRGPMRRLVSVRERPDKDAYAVAAARELQRLGQVTETADVRYVLYGHTHAPKQVVLKSNPDHGFADPDMYLNTGTWRPAYAQAADEDGFAGMKNLTYTIIYAPIEQAGARQTVEAWTGTLIDDDVTSGLPASVNLVGRERRTA